MLVRRTDAGRKYALSSAIVVVVPEISESCAAHHAADRLRAIRVRDDEHVRLERALDAVQRPQRLAGARAPNHEPPSGNALEIERVHRLSDLEHHVVGDVDDVVDRPDAGGREPIGEPRRRGPDADLEHLRAVPRAQRPASSIVRGRSTESAMPARPGCAWASPPVHVSGQPQRQAPDCRRLAREAHVTQAVRPVRGDLEVDDGLGSGLDAPPPRIRAGRSPSRRPRGRPARRTSSRSQ